MEELSSGTISNDCGVKFLDYQLHGVPEYWIINPEPLMLEQYILDGNEYQLAKKVKKGMIKSVVVEGFEIDVKALTDDQAFLDAMKKMMG